MDFCGLEYLQSIDLNISNIEYCTMNQTDKQGHRWSTFETTYDNEPSVTNAI